MWPPPLRAAPSALTLSRADAFGSSSTRFQFPGSERAIRRPRPACIARSCRVALMPFLNRTSTSPRRYCAPVTGSICQLSGTVPWKPVYRSRAGEADPCESTEPTRRRDVVHAGFAARRYRSWLLLFRKADDHRGHRNDQREKSSVHIGCPQSPRNSERVERRQLTIAILIENIAEVYSPVRSGTKLCWIRSCSMRA